MNDQITDQFGIGAALRTCASIYLIQARRSGRTTAMLNSLKNGDRIVFADKREAERVRRLCKQRNIDCIVIDPKRDEKLSDYPRSTGRTLFDHGWIEQYYKNAIERAEMRIAMMQETFSALDYTSPEYTAPEYFTEHRDPFRT